MDRMIERRLVFQIAGYDPVDAAGHYRRFVRGVPIFARTWNVGVEASALGGAEPRQWTVTTRAPNWHVETVYRPLVWDDIIVKDFSTPVLRKLGRFMLALYDIFVTGTVFRYFRANFQYGFFFLFPAVYLIAFGAIGLAAGRWTAGLLSLQGVSYALAAAAVAIAAFFALLQWPGRRWRVLQALDDWIFSWDFLHGRRPDMDARLDRFARQLIEAANDKSFDEIIVCGHSLGATMAVATAARALALDPALGTRGPKVCVMTVGSTIPKFSLHPDAARIRADIERLAAPGAVEWAEFHARADPISFYKFDPVTGQRVDDRFDRKPVIRMVRIRGMLEPETYRRIRFRFMRVHHQFVMANERRNAYDFYMMGCGPIPFMTSVMAIEGPAAMIGPDGALTVQQAEQAAR
jgi:pimeloyl-ACP methyl ester carboxylesterase